MAVGITYTKIVRGGQSEDGFYTVNGAFEADRAAAEQVAVRLEMGGYDAQIEIISQRGPDDPASGPPGYLVRTGTFATQAGAEALRAVLTAKRYTGLRTGVEAVLDSSGRVIELRETRGGTIPENGSVLSGTGTVARWLLAHAKPRRAINITTIITADGAPLAPGTGVVNGGPRLLSNGEPDVTAYQEDFVWLENLEFYYRFSVRRNPRTLAGITPDGKLLLVAVDGRQPGYSVGASFEESVRIMQALGTEEAVNLDGGGSTTITIGEETHKPPVRRYRRASYWSRRSLAAVS